MIGGGGGSRWSGGGVVGQNCLKMSQNAQNMGETRYFLNRLSSLVILVPHLSRPRLILPFRLALQTHKVGEFKKSKISSKNTDFRDWSHAVLMGINQLPAVENLQTRRL